MQYIGKLMREVDPAPIRARLQQWTGVAREHTALQHLAERWRGRLLDEADALAAFADAYPGSDLQRLRSLVASIERDKSAGRPLRNYRELFRIVRDIVAKSSATGNTEDTEDRERGQNQELHLLLLSVTSVTSVFSVVAFRN